MVVAGICLLLAIVVPATVRLRENARLSQCRANIAKVTSAVLMYAEDNQKTFPLLPGNSANGVWWFYKELVKGRMGLVGPSTRQDKVFACPDDRGYDEPWPFHASAKFDYGSYVFNGVNLPGIPNLAGKKAATVKEPAKTLLMMEWTAHAPLSWHKSRTGRKNQPFYNDAENMVGFVDGHVKFIKIYYDGIDAAYTRDPIPGYEYKYSGD